MPGHAQLDDLDLALDRRVPDPLEERAALQRIVQLARAVGRENHRRAASRPDRAELGNGDLEVGEHLEQERLELLVGAVDLVDQEHDRVVRVDRLEQRAADQELLAEELVLRDGALLGGTQVQQLAGVVPLVHGVGDVEALVALQADQPRVGRARERLRGLGLAHSRLALEQEGLLERQRQEERGREAAIGQIVGRTEGLLELVDIAKGHGRRVIQNRANLERIDHRSLPQAGEGDYILANSEP